jgi:hypothetical protein
MRLENESHARIHRTPKAVRAKCGQMLIFVREAFGVRAHLRALWSFHMCVYALIQRR